MTDAIAGTFADMRFVKTRKVCQIIVELPIENADKFVRLFGTPNPHQEVWVALARLQAEPTADAGTEVLPVAEQRHPVAVRSEGERAVTRAVMLCKDKTFQEWATQDQDNGGSWDERSAREYIVRCCGVQSRSEFKDNVDARMKLYRLITKFESETGRMAEVRS